ncbi:MAG: anti-sigma factor family protein [Akkermansiaceae bacterium]
MNKDNITSPNEATLTLWMDGELKGDELKYVELWVQEHPEILAERDAVQAMNQQISTHLPNSIEPPYPEFFNQQVLRQINQDNLDSQTTETKQKASFWQWFAAPMAAAGMAACFFLGTQIKSSPEYNQSGKVAQYSSVYTPDGSVHADMFNSDEEGITVIVLEGLQDIPDELNIVGNSHRPKDNSSSMMAVHFPASL